MNFFAESQPNFFDEHTHWVSEVPGTASSSCKFVPIVHELIVPSSCDQSHRRAQPSSTIFFRNLYNEGSETSVGAAFYAHFR
jgi:hypothetical protein